MIAIAVVASLVAYAWVMGYMNFQTAKVGNAIQIPSYASQGGFLTVYVQNVGQGTVNIIADSSVYVNDGLRLVKQSPSGNDVAANAKIEVGEGKTVELVTDYPYTAGEKVSIKIVTVEGTTMTVKGTTSSTGSTTTTSGYTITASVVGTGGTISSPGANSVTQGQSITFTITASAGYSIADVTVDGASQGAISSYTFDNVQADHTIVASFSGVTNTITATAGTGGAISPSGSVSVNYGADQEFTITPQNGYHIADVLVDEVSVGAVPTYTFTSVTSGHSISATFASTEHKVSFAQTGSGSTVTVSYQIDGGATQTGDAPFDVMVAEGHTITYAYPATIGTTGTRYVLSNNPGTSQTISTSDISVSGTYNTQYYVTFEVSPSSSGTTTASGWFDAGVSGQAISASPSGSYTFSAWSATSGSVTFASSTSASTTMTVNAPSTVRATFAAGTVQVTFSYTTSGGGNGGAPTVTYIQNGVTKSVTLTSSKTVTADVGSSYSYSTLLPNSGTTEQWQTTTATGTITTTGTINPTYNHQYYVTLKVSRTGNTVTPSSNWFNAGSSISISASAGSGGHTFWYWTAGGASITFGNQWSSSTTATINGAGTITATYH